MKKIKASRKWCLLKQAIKDEVFFDWNFVKKFLLVTCTASYFIYTSPIILETAKGIINNIKMQEDIDIDKIKEEMKDIIICADLNFGLDTEYQIADGILYDKDLNKIDLSGERKGILLSKIGITNNTLKEMNLIESNPQFLMLNVLAITDGFINTLPPSLEVLGITECDYITDLQDLSVQCPNIKELSLDRQTSLNSLDFIYDLKKLQTLSIVDTYGVTEELVNYCQENNITVKSNGTEIENTKKIKQIVKEIIHPNMSDTEKIQSICKYVIDRIKYDSNLSNESNITPIDHALNGEGVCISYTYLTSVLLKEAGITSYRINSDSHIWNLIKLDDEYFYVDTTSIDNSAINKIIYKIFGVSPFYMSSPNNNFLSPMYNVSSKKANIPDELLEEIMAKENEKNIIEKYKSIVGIGLIYLLEVAWGLITYLNLGETKEILLDFVTTLEMIFYSYSSLKEKELKKINK